MKTTMADWEEVKKLAADFQRVQLSSTKQKLSERNVIEIVTKLIELGSIEVIYTVDGKEYITPYELRKEIKEELLVHGGRINLVELTQILNVDFNHVESKANELVHQEQNLSIVLGQLIDKSYMDMLAEEVNDNLQEKGHVTIPELTKQYDLPADFLSRNLHSRLGTIIEGHIDSYDKDIIYTDAFITRMKAQIRGALSAVTRPVLVGTFVQLYKFQERIFFNILEELVNTKVLAGSISGRLDKATYIPHIYTKSQNEWVDNFFRQNGYLEYDALKRLGITDPKDFIKKRFKGEQLLFLSTCCTGHTILDQIEVSVEEALNDGSWVDIMPLLPSVFSNKDANTLLAGCLKNHSNAIICCETIVASDKLISECSKPFPDLMAIKAEKDAKSHPVFKSGFESELNSKSDTSTAGNTKEDKKDQRRKKAAAGSGSTKSGGGTQGREIKTKSVKKKGYKGRDVEVDSDEETMVAKPKSRSTEIEFMNIEEIENIIRKNKALEDCPDELVTEIAQQLIRPLTKQYQEVAKSIFLQTSGLSSSKRKKTQVELQDKLIGLWTNARLFEKGLKLFEDDTETVLTRHLLRTVCSDITNLVLNAIAADHMVSVEDEAQLTIESRAKLIAKIPGDSNVLLTKLNSSLNGKSLEDFFNTLDILCGPAHLGILLKKPDKKKERQLTFSHRQTLCDQITAEIDPAMTLHLACVILFQKFTQCILHVPGKCVPQVVMFLKPHLEPDSFKELVHLQDLVIAELQRQQSGGDAEEKDIPILEDTINKVKAVAMTTKKSILNSNSSGADAVEM
ncbi:E3 UFM1-protein ligase 1 [Mactra antiquata]